MSTYKYCFFFTREFKQSVAEPPADVKEAFAAYANGGGGTSPEGHMRAEQLLRFLVEAQGETGITLGEVQAIVGQLRLQPSKATQSDAISLDDFFQFLFSDDFNPPIRSEVHQDMSLPLSQYYIYTSHNTYLTGNQLSSDSSDIPIINALERGVRVIELDMWPNGTKDDIDIVHGRTLTSPVRMSKCLSSIKQYAFSASPYPVVITLENHLTPDLQAKVAEMITQTFGDMLYCPEEEFFKEFPSPEDLKNRIIISTKPPEEYLESKNCKEDGKVDGSSKDGDVANLSISRELCDENAEDQDEEYSDNDERGFQKNSIPAYRRIITVPAGKPQGRVRDALAVDPDKVRRLSLSEHKLSKAAASHGAELVRFTQRNILRVYPKGTRVTSSNYKPLLGWIYGAQMVAFNMQNQGKSLWLMQGLFRGNGGCGYVKKPDFLLKDGLLDEVSDPESKLPPKKTLKVKIYMGDGWSMDFSKTYFDTYSPPDFYVRVGIAGVPADSIMKKTKTIENDWVPVWDEEFSFPLTCPELALLRIKVLDHDKSERDDFGGQSCLPVWELRPGIRAVPLFDEKGNKFNTVRLLMQFGFV